MRSIMSKLGLPAVLIGSLLSTGCEKNPLISIEVIGDGGVMASVGNSCIGNEAYDSEGNKLTSFASILGIPECTGVYKGEVTFTAEPAEGEVFYGWSDACTGNESTCTTTGAGNNTNMASGRPLTAFFYPADVAAALDELAIEDVWVQNCIGESMVVQGVTEVTALTEANCLLSHPLVQVESVDLAALTAAENLQSLVLAPRTKTSFAGFLFHASANDPEGVAIPGLDLALLNNFAQLDSFQLMRLNAENFDFQLPSLTSLEIGASNMTDLDFLQGQPNLEVLDLDNAAGLMTPEGIANIESLSALTSLSLQSNGLTSLDPLANLTQITALNVASNSELTDIDALSAMPGMTVLNLSGTAITSLDPIANMAGLEVLSATSLPGDLDATVFAAASFANLTELALSGSDIDDADFAAIGSNPLPNLTLLNVSVNPISDLSPLTAANLPVISELRVSSSHVTDVTPLFGLTSLTTVALGSAADAPEMISCDQKEVLEAALPGAEVSLFAYTINGQPAGCADL